MQFVLEQIWSIYRIINRKIEHYYQYKIYMLYIMKCHQYIVSTHIFSYLFNDYLIQI